MKITICGSIAFFDEMLEFKQKLEALGQEVKMPLAEVKDQNGETISAQEYMAMRKTETDHQSWIWDRKAEAIKEHFNKIVWSEAVLILNYTKNDIPNYIGANTLLEMGLAFHLDKKIYLLNDIPEINYKEEILGMKPVVINGDLTQVV